MVDAGETTMTGGHIRLARKHIGDETFLLTYRDGVSNIDIDALIHTHRQDKSLVTLTAVQPPGRFGTLSLASDQTKVHQFLEKQKVMEPGLTAATLLLSLKLLTTSRAAIPRGSRNH